MKRIIFWASLVLGAFNLCAEERDLNFSSACEKNFVTIGIAGDILIHKALYKNVVTKGEHFDLIWQKLLPIINKADFTLANLEGPSALGIDQNGKDRGDVGFVYDDFIYSGTNFIFNYHPRLLEDLKRSGFDLLTGANNHSMDRFSLGLDRTIEAAKKIPLPLVGIRHSGEAEEDFFKIVQVKNMRLAFLGCTEYINIPDQDNQVLFCEDQKIFTLIRSLGNRPDVDALIVLPHWGVEYSTSEKPYQKEYARRYLDAGASAVVGSHPHVLEPWEKYITKSGRETIIMYSLGNFIAAQDTVVRQTGAMTYIGFTKKNDTAKAQIFGVGYTPTIRADLSIVPLDMVSNKEANTIVESMFGKKGRLPVLKKLSDQKCPIL